MLRIRSRRSWQAKKPHSTPVRVTHKRLGYYVHHTVTAMGAPYFEMLRKVDHVPAKERKGLVKEMVKLEAEHMRYLQTLAWGRGFADISYNFVIFPSGHVWRGRGWEFLGAHNDGENEETIGAVAVGNYEGDVPTKAMLDSFVKLFRRGRSLRRVADEFFIRGHRDSDATACPGEHLYQRIPWMRKEVA